MNLDDYLMVGTVGIDAATWHGGFYADDLPEDWRMASYSTLLRSVLLPPQELVKAIESDWADEVDDTFRFVLSAGLDDIDRLMTLPPLLLDRSAGAVVVLDDVSPAQDSCARIDELNQIMPVCLDLAENAIGSGDLVSLCERLGMAQVWYPSRHQAPLPQGRMLVAIVEESSLPQLRQIIDTLAQWMDGSRPVGLFHAFSDNAAEQAQQTRLLAEMMGV